MLVTLLGMMTLGGRLTQIQVLDRSTYADLGARQGTTIHEIVATRGARREF